MRKRGICILEGNLPFVCLIKAFWNRGVFKNSSWPLKAALFSNWCYIFISVCERECLGAVFFFLYFCFSALMALSLSLWIHLSTVKSSVERQPNLWPLTSSCLHQIVKYQLNRLRPHSQWRVTDVNADKLKSKNYPFKGVFPSYFNGRDELLLFLLLVILHIISCSWRQRLRKLVYLQLCIMTYPKWSKLLSIQGIKTKIKTPHSLLPFHTKVIDEKLRIIPALTGCNIKICLITLAAF